MKKIPYGRQHITQQDIDAVIKVLKSDFLTQGPKINEFEVAFADYVGAKYAVAVSNGTAALHLSILALGVKPGDKVITTSITFSATANCVLYAGGEVVFADINPKTYLLDINEVERLLKAAPKGTHKGIITVDFAGKAMNMEAFRKLADVYDCWLVEDACHAPGGYFVDSKEVKQLCGNGNFADLAIFSFHPVKHIATGEGGMITTNNEDLYNHLRNLRTHGIQQNKELYHYNHGIWYYEMQELGFNYRLTDIASALGLSQLKRAESGLDRRREIARIYNEAFKGIPTINHYGYDEGHAYHLYVIEAKDRDRLINYLRDNKIIAQVHYIPVHLMPYYRQYGWKEDDLPNAESYYKCCLSLPMYPSIKSDEVAFVIDRIKEFYA